MSTVTIVAIVAVLVIVAAFAVTRWNKTRVAHRERVREQLSTEAEGHDAQVVANQARAKDLSKRAEELSREADETRAGAARAKGAAERHDKRSQEAKRKLETL